MYLADTECDLPGLLLLIACSECGDLLCVAKEERERERE
jgi:hypothetical protein